MSLSRRLLDLARANLNALLDRATGDTPVGDLTDDELEAELLRRRERRERDEAARRTREAAEEAARLRGAERRGQPAPAKRARSDGKRASARPLGAAAERRVAALYAQLEVPNGAPFDDVKHSFRRLMRKYHPDLHAGDPKKHAAATQLTASLTQAYNELETILLGGPNRGG